MRASLHKPREAGDALLNLLSSVLSKPKSAKISETVAEVTARIARQLDQSGVKASEFVFANVLKELGEKTVGDFGSAVQKGLLGEAAGGGNGAGNSLLLKSLDGRKSGDIGWEELLEFGGKRFFHGKQPHREDGEERPQSIETCAQGDN